MDRRLLSFLGLARRAGKLCLGRDAAEESIRAAKAEALLLASDISERSARQIRRDAAEHGVPVLCLSLIHIFGSCKDVFLNNSLRHKIGTTPCV